jgi:hypothetical protein
MSRIRADRIVNRAGTGAPEFPNGIVITGVATATTLNQNVTGIVSASGGFSIGIQSAGVSIANTITALNFVGSGNTFVYNSATKTVDISISGSSGGGSGVSTTGITTGYIWSNPQSVDSAISLTQSGHNYGMFGPVALNATVTVGAGNTFTVV